MSQINGTLVLTKIGEDGEEASIVHTTGASFSSSVDLQEATTKDSNGFRELLEGAGTMEANISVDGYADFEHTDGNVNELQTKLKAREKFGFIFGPDSPRDGETSVSQISGDCMLSSNDYDAPTEENSTFSAEFEVTGEWSIDEVS